MAVDSSAAPRYESAIPPYVVEPIRGTIDATVTVPGSKSLTNRALLIAGLAAGTSRIHGSLDSADTQAMFECVRRLGAQVSGTLGSGSVDIGGVDGRLGPRPLDLYVNQSGTTARFVTPVAALSSGPALIDGHPPMRARPMRETMAALRSLGAQVPNSDALPLSLGGGGVDGGHINIAGDASSQFLSGLLIAAPYFETGLRATVAGPLVSRPYVDMTTHVMDAFGVQVDQPSELTYVVDPDRYRAATYHVEPDASTASYFFAAAAMTRGRVLIEGLGAATLQGDMAFLDVLEAMGAVVRQGAYWTEVVGRAVVGLDVDMANFSDTVPTLAVVAAGAESPTRIRNVGFIAAKESDRISAVVTELARVGVRCERHDDGFTVHPGPISPAVVHTYDDHRIAMAFSLLGLRNEGIQIADPGCVAKTFPGYWEAFEALRPNETSDEAPATG